jgi:hypothetical protein
MPSTTHRPSGVTTIQARRPPTRHPHPAGGYPRCSLAEAVWGGQRGAPEGLFALNAVWLEFAVTAADLAGAY